MFMFIAFGLLLDMVSLLGVLIVKSPLFRFLSARSIEVQVEPESIRLGEVDRFIELVRVKFPAIVKVCASTLAQIALLPVEKTTSPDVDVPKVTLAPPLLVTNTFGFLVVPNEADIVPDPLPPKYTFVALKRLSNSRFLAAEVLSVTCMLVIVDVRLASDDEVYNAPLPVKYKLGVIIVLGRLPFAENVLIIRSFEEEIVPAVSEAAPILLVVRLRFMLPEVIVKLPTVNLVSKDGVKLLPPPKVSVLLEISLFVTTELVKRFIAILLVSALFIVIALVVLIVNEPVLNCLPAKSMEVKLEPERIKSGVALEVIVPTRVRFPAIVTVWVATLFQFTLVPGAKVKGPSVEFVKVIGACPVLVTSTAGLLVVPREAVIGPVPIPAKDAVDALNCVSKVSVLLAAVLPVTYTLPIEDTSCDPPTVYKGPTPVNTKLEPEILLAAVVEVAIVPNSAPASIDMFPATSDTLVVGWVLK